MVLELEKSASNFYRLRIGNKLLVFFSYQTPIAFIDEKNRFVVSRNEWGKTTGKHLNIVDHGTSRAKAKRVPHRVFRSLLAQALNNLSAFSECDDLLESMS